MQITFESIFGYEEEVVTVNAELDWNEGERRTLEYPGVLAGWSVCDLSVTMNGVELELTKREYEIFCEDAIEYANKNL